MPMAGRDCCCFMAQDASLPKDVCSDNGADEGIGIWVIEEADVGVCCWTPEPELDPVPSWSNVGPAVGLAGDVPCADGGGVGIGAYDAG